MGPFLLPAVLTLCLALGSCHHKPTLQEMGVVLDTLSAEASAALWPDSTNSPQCHVSLELITFSNKEHSPLNDSLLRSGILSPEYLSLTPISLTPRQAVDSFISRYTSDYPEFYTGIYTDEGDSAATIGYNLRTSIEEGRDSILTYKARITNRQGSLTTEYTRCVNIDLGGKRLLHLDDVFVPGATKGLEEESKNQKGKIVHQERYSGSMTRSFYIGEEVKEEDVKAKFENGVLTLDFPKEKTIKLPEKKTIQIEG